MIGRPPRTRNDRQQNPQISEEQLKTELQRQAENKKRELRMKQLQEKEENLKQLEYAGQDVESFRNKVYADYQDVIPQQSKAEQERAARIKLREEERLRRKNGLGSAYEQEKERLPAQLEQKLLKNLNQMNNNNQNADWLDKQQVVSNQNNMNYHHQQQPVINYYPDQYQGAKQIQQSQLSNQLKNESHKYSEKPNYDQRHQPPQMNNNSNYQKNKNNEAAEQEREKKRKYKEQLDMQISQKGQQNQHQHQSQLVSQQQYHQQPLQNQQQQLQQKPNSQQGQRQPQVEVDFFSKFGQPQSQQGWRQQQQQQQNQDNVAMQRMKYREELDRQIQEKKNREFEQQQLKNQQDYSKRPVSNPTNVFDLPSEYDQRNNQPPQSPNYYQPPQSAPTDDQTKGRFLQRRFTSGQPEDPQKQAQKEQYAEELKRQMEEKKRKKKQEEEENRRRDELEQQQYQQQLQQEKRRQEEQAKQKYSEQFDQPPQIVQQKEIGRRGKQNLQNEQPQQDIIKKSALQILSPEGDSQREQLSYVQDQKHQQHQQHQQQYVAQQQPQYQQYSQPQQLIQQTPYQNNPYHPPISPLQNVYNQFHLQDNLQQYQQVLFNDQNSHNPQAIMVHQQYLMQLQQNRQEIDLVRQILEEKLRLQQIEMQNQLLIDQYQRKVMDIQKEQKLFEQEITKLQDFIQGKQKRPLDPTVFASSVFFNALGKKENINMSPHQQQVMNIQPIKISPFSSPTANSQANQFYLQVKQSDVSSQYPNQYQDLNQLISEKNQQPQLQQQQKLLQQQQSQQQQQQQLQSQQQQLQILKPKGITESMIDNDVELPGESEYVNYTEEYLGKSFMPELRELKQKVQQSENYKQTENTKTLQSQQFKTLQSQNFSNNDFQTNQQQKSSNTDESCELPTNAIQKSIPPQFSRVQGSQNLQDNFQDKELEESNQNSDEEIYEQKDFDPEEEEVNEQGTDNPFDQHDQGDDQNENSDREQYDIEIPNPQNYDLNMLKTQEYYAMFVENIKPQSRQQELKFPTKLLQQNTIQLNNDTIQQSSLCDQSEIVESQLKCNNDKQGDVEEVQMSQAQFSVYQQSMAIPEDEEPSQPSISQKNLRNSSRKYQKPKTVDIFKNEQQKNSNQQSQNQIPQFQEQSRCTNQQIPDQSRCTNLQMPDQSRCTNQNPIASQTFLYQPRVELVKSRLENLFQHTNELMADLPKVKVEKIVALDDDEMKSYKIEENSQWQQQLDLFNYEQSHS